MTSTLLAVTVLTFGQAIDGWLAKAIEQRASLRLPETIFQRVLSETGHSQAPLGYTESQMAGFPQNPYLLRLVTNAFRDVRMVPEYSGLLTDNLLQAGGRVDSLAYLAWSQVDVRAGREWPYPSSADPWLASWIPAKATQAEAFRLAWTRLRAKGEPPKLDKKLERLLLRILIAADSSNLYLQQAIPTEFKGGSAVDFWRLASAPYLGEANDDNILVKDRRSYDLQRRFDPALSGFGSALFLRGIQAALTEFKADRQGLKPLAKTVSFQTSLGLVVIGGIGNETHTRDAFLVIETGGDDQYRGRVATPANPRQPISLILDLAGKDRYGTQEDQATVAMGLGGVGILIDQGGNDVYQAGDGGIGAGLFGIGLLLDESGDDQYLLKKTFGIGAAYFGVGLVADLTGNDVYRSLALSMGFGGTFGFGALIELEGDDDYKTADEGNPSIAWGGKTVSLSLGCGYGRRADYGDGQSQAGGIGIVIDGRGDDQYHSSIFSMGSGYWWGFGIMEDRAGDDTYRCTHYSLGSGAHFALGSFVDLAGNDSYNDRPDAVERWGALGRDGAIAVCIDAAGDDVWGNLTGGHADLNSIALFWDQKGNDLYKRMQPFDPASFGNRPFGSCVPYGSFRNFRDRMKSVGVFLDTQGIDVYPPGMTAAENSSWKINSGPNEFGFGWDLEANR
ncbi:MAG: hypothetical protein MUC92_03275 [Fimbriimonadaceae bacterium]|jgi:hypothetical protein|nr:hypothetical protein [Fimbriimonadaceae bacterium]